MLKRIDHVGVIVDDLAQARAFVESLGMELDRELDRPDLRAAFYRVGDGSMIELIEVTTDEGRRTRLGEGNTARIEHIAVEVDDLGAALPALRGLGIDFNAPEPVAIGRNLNVWTLAETCDGVQYQFFQKNAVAPES
jgi:methylmalonyl-CoA/ethylmalonyl-CoA epimerase